MTPIVSQPQQNDHKQQVTVPEAADVLSRTESHCFPVRARCHDYFGPKERTAKATQYRLYDQVRITFC